jgi:hypothetical protein
MYRIKTLVAYQNARTVGREQTSGFYCFAMYTVLQWGWCSSRMRVIERQPQNPIKYNIMELIRQSHGLSWKKDLLLDIHFLI